MKYPKLKCGRFRVLPARRTALLPFFYLALISLPEARALAQSTQLSGSQTRIMTNVQSGTSYTILASDCGKLISFFNSASVAVAIPQAGPTGLAAGCWMDIQNIGPGAVTLTPLTSLIDQSASLQLTANQGLRLVSTGTAYLTQRGQGSGASSTGDGSIGGVNAQTANYTAVSGDNGKLVTMNGTSLTLLLPGTPPPPPWVIFAQNLNASPATISGNGNSINAAGNLTLNLGQATWIFSDGTNYLAQTPVSCGFGTTCSFTGSGVSVAVDTNVFATKVNTRLAAYVFDGGGAALSGTLDACVDVPSAATITGVTLLADQAGTATVDVRTVPYSTYTQPASAATITASATPALSSAVKYQDTTLTGWTTAVAGNTMMCFHLTSPSTVTWVMVDVKGIAQ